ncbi:RluA family pseudouridine synthase [Sandaracinus amylolyticus]|uniref:RluA family pseudouridine synthase n=1 Tax=Sandaracinus amylolyticus TaxID=927083 RepID=UPI001F02ED17|nr:pseudouridine synthase [Sandaracinus amylolyticus]UJR79290.1 Ribosomal large subunit pseudouridine synthase D [Sandaracinus amylolyticus]
MSNVSIVVDAAHDGATLAAVVRESLGAASGEAVPWSRARDLCRTGRVTVDGALARDDAMRVKAGAKVDIAPTAPKRTEGVLPREAVLHLDADVIVVNKPAGVVTVPFEPGERDTLVDRVRALVTRIEKARRQERGGGARDPMVGVVQRLDKDTTGVLVLARTMSAKRALEDQLREHSVERRYLAIAHGDVPTAKHETMLVQDRGDGLRGSWGRFRGHAGPPPEHAKRAVTYVRRIEALRGATLVECRLETGKQHQIRIHLSEAGHPLVGEPVYVRDHAGPRIAAPRPMLHAGTLGFVHPRSGETVRFEAAPPPDFDACLASLRQR